MSGIGIGLSSAFGSFPLQYLLRDEFNDTLAAGSVHGTAATPGPGTRTVVDTGNTLNLSDDKLNHSGRVAAGDPGFWLNSITRVAGLMALYQLNISADGRTVIGFDTGQTGNPTENFFHFRLGSGIRAIGDGGEQIVGAYSGTTDYYLAITLRAAGCFYFIKGGAFSTWTLLFIGATKNTATLYPGTGVGAVASTVAYDYIRVPDALLLPIPLVSDGFTDDNGMSLDAHNTDGLGHAEGVAGGIGVGGSGLSWTEESGAWDIQSNRANPNGAAIATIEAGDADVFIDCTVNGGAADQPAILLRWLDTSNYWYLQADRANNQFELHEYNATVDTVRASAAVTFNDSTDYNLRAIAYGQTIDGYADGNNKITYGSAALNETKTEHGIRSENTAGQFDDFVIYARDGYSALSAF